MSAPADTGAPKARRRMSRGKRIALIVGVALAVLLGLGLLLRYGVLLPQSRVMIEARTEGLKIGRFGELHLQGLSGDIWDEFTIQRLTIADEKGVWLEARQVHVDWNYPQLLRRRFQADEVSAQHVRLLRRPILTPKTESRGLPISFDIDALRARLEMTPEFSYRHGVYDVAGALEVGRRNSGQAGRIRAESVLHPGDFLDVRFGFGGERPLLVDASAREARGGALAGALGLPADQPFLLEVDAKGQDGRGRFEAVARSGETVPLQAVGSWTPDGGRAEGRVSLAASSLAEPLEQRLGPELSFQVSARRATSELLQLAAQVTSANVDLTASGRANFEARRTGPDGLTIALQAEDGSPLLPGMEAGPLSLNGRLVGGLDKWRFAGNAQGAQLALADYSLAQLAGPVEISGEGERLTLQTRLAGRGGRGDGLPAALLGASPTASLEATRLPDGRLLIESVEAKGAGLQLTATGDRGLLGRLTFRGRAELSNLDDIRPGASGGLVADWRAAQANADAPWVLEVDADGRRFSSGFALLDDLLGRSPDLSLQARVDQGQMVVSRASLTGEDLRATAAGVISGPEGLRVKVDWRVDGPVAVGPLEITGDARGSGALTGELGAPRLNLIARFDSVDVPRLPLRDVRMNLRLAPQGAGQAGAISLVAQSPYGAARARADLAFPPSGLRLNNISVDAGGVQAGGSVTLASGGPASADLTLQVGPGALLSAGTVTGDLEIVDARPSPRVAVSLVARNAVPLGSNVTLRNGQISGRGTLARLPYSAELAGVSPQGRFSLDGQGLLTRDAPAYQVTFSGTGAVAGETLRTTEPAVLRFGGEAQTARLRLATREGGTIAADARLNETSAQLQAQLTNLRLSLINQDLAGRANAEIDLQGRGGELTGDLQARIVDARALGSPTNLGLDATVQGRLSDDVLRLTANASNEQGLRAQADLAIPTEASAAPLRLALHRQRPIRGDFSAAGEIRPLWDVLIGGERTLSGKASVSGRLGGTLADPRITGRAAVDGGRFVDGATGLTLTNAVLRANFEDRTINVTQASGTDGEGGRLSGSGRISLQRNGPSNFRLNLTSFQLIDTDAAQASASGQATLSRAATGQLKLTGKLQIDEAEISPEPLAPSGVVQMPVTEINVPEHLEREIEAPSPSGPAVALDVSIDAPRRVFVRGRGLDVELRVDAHVGGTTADPTLTGTARVVRGDYQFAGKRFIFDRESLVYLSTEPGRIRLNLTATREDPALTAVVRIRGTAAQPEITLSSTPSLPQDEILSQVLFGRSAAQLSAFEAAQLASAISSMSGGGGFDLLGELRSFAGLDRLALVGGESGLMVAGGRYISDDVYLEIIGGGREGPAVQVEWRVNRRLSVLSRLMGQGGTNLAVRWRRNY